MLSHSYFFYPQPVLRGFHSLKHFIITKVYNQLKIILILFCITPCYGFSQDDAERYENAIYDSNLVSVQLFRLGWSNSYPIISLNNPDHQIQLSFDDLTGAPRDFMYSFIHCDAEWKPSDLNLLEYQIGPNDDMIRDMVFSRGARQRFVHYDLFFPNNRISLTLSGNYILKIEDAATRETVITRRFYVVEESIAIQPRIKQATQARYRFTHHEVDFDLLALDYNITNPYSDLQVHVFQNQRPDNAKYDLSPTFVKQNEVIYEYDDRNLFNGTNEFRFFDTRDLNYQALRTASTQLINDTFNIFIIPDEVRSVRQYIDYGDINGRYLIHRTDPRDIALIDAEYVWVHFTLPYPAPLMNAGMFLYGEFTNWKFDPDYEMQYDSELKAYTGKVLLKQGYYNYMYAAANLEKGAGDVTLIEGNHFEAENEYLFLVYHRKIGEIYDRLIGFKIEKFQNK